MDKISRTKILLQILCCLFITIACSVENQRNGQIDRYFTQSDSLVYTIVPNDYIWGAPLAMDYLDSAIIVFDEKTYNGLYHRISCNTPDSVTDFGERGQGINEFMMPLDFQTTYNGEYTIFDYAQKKLFQINPSKSLTSFQTVLKDTTPNTVKLLASRYDTYISFGFYQDCMFMLKDKSGKQLKKIGDFPSRDNNEKKQINQLKGMAYQGTWKINPTNDKFVYATNSADILYFYRIDSTDITSIKKYELNYPTYQVKEKGYARSAPLSTENKKTFLSVSVSDKFVYLLYSGKCFKDAGLKALEGNIIYVFDWNGEPVKKYLLNIPITQLCLDYHSNELYGFANLPNPTLVKFKLK